MPIAMARRSGNFDRTFRVSSKGVVVALGATTYVAGGAKPAVVVVTAAAACPAGASCVEDAEQSSCDDGQHGKDDGNGADGECENGVDTKTHAPCTDPPSDASEQSVGNSTALSAIAVLEASAFSRPDPLARVLGRRVSVARKVAQTASVRASGRGSPQSGQAASFAILRSTVLFQ